ncbi:MAG: amidohydrolase family protein [Halobacteriales archaeon]|nr:amidohydrolase family protein [Halobacteriales archaeon]
MDAGGHLVSPSFVDPHLHLDKVYTYDAAGEDAVERYQAGEMGDAMGAIESASAVKADYDESRIYENARRAVELGIRHGVLHHRAFADVDTAAGLEGVKALLRLRDDYADVVDLRVVAFPQDGLLRDPGAESLVEEAMALGADEVGGIPWIEFTEADAREHVDRMVDLAVEHDADVAMLTDDAGDPGLRTTEYLATAAIDAGWEGRVTACHARAMALYPEPYRRKLYTLLDRAGVSVVTDPQTGPLHVPVDELLEAGIPVALGQDDIADAYYPFGRNSLLEVGFLAAHLLWKTTADDLQEIHAMLTEHGATSLGLEAHGLAEGTPADLVLLDAASVPEAIGQQALVTHVISGGELVAESRLETTRYG